MRLRMVVVTLLALLAVAQIPGALVPALVFAQDPEQPPGTPHHPQPCNRGLEPVGHQCLCKRICVHDENGKVIGVQEDTACRAYCDKELCKCGVMDCEDESPRS